MKKKILALALSALLMVLPCASVHAASTTAAAEKTPYELYMESFTKLADVDSFAFTMDMAMTMDLMGMSIDMLYNIEAEQAMTAEGMMEMKMVMTSSAFGVEDVSSVYYKDGMYYTETSESKTKIPMDMEDVMETTLSITGSDLGIDEEAILEQELIETEDGYEIWITLDGAAFTESVGLVSDLMGGLMDFDGEYEFGEIIFVVLLDDEMNFEGIIIHMSIDMVVMEVPVAVTCVITMEYTQIGDVEIEFPEDLEDYVLLEV